MSSDRPISLSLAAFPGKHHAQALDLALRLRAQENVEPALGAISLDHVQLVPQNMGKLDERLVDELIACAADAKLKTQFRLHANVRVLDKHRIADLSTFDMNMDWFEAAARVSKRLNAPAYTAHSGRRKEASLNQVLDNARRCADLFECPVGVEGQYPSSHDYMIATWDEYRTVFDSGVPYVVDLSHINILAHQTRNRNESLLADMLACDRCIEVHLSDNDGTGDWHQVCQIRPWWYHLLQHVSSSAVVFTEGNHLRQR